MTEGEEKVLTKKAEMLSLRESYFSGMKLCLDGEFDKAVEVFKRAYSVALSIGEGVMASIMIHCICYCYTNLADSSSMINFCDAEKIRHGGELEPGIFSFYYSIACLFRKQYEKAAEIANDGIKFEQRSNCLKIVHPAYYYEIAYRAYSALGL